MPIIKSAIKKLRQDRARTKINAVKRSQLKTAIKETKGKKSAETLAKAFSALDKAVKRGLIHNNKAARQKSSLAKLIKSTAKTKVVAKKARTTKARKAK